MYKIAKPFFIVVEMPLHAGSGQDLGIVDMPIQRERHTGFPKIEGSGLKGSIREVFEERLTEDDDKKRIHLAFGYDDSEENRNIREFFKDKKEFAGALGFTDARLLLFPVKSMKGVFAWITCPKVLERFKKDLELCSLRFKNGDSEIIIPTNNNLKTVDDKGKCLVANENEIGINGTAILEEYSFGIQNGNIENLANSLAGNISNDEIKNKLVILSDDDFRDFVNLSTEVVTRTKIDNETGTVQSGALFTEEYLPTETVMYSLALTTPIFNKDKGIFKKTDSKKEEELVMDFFERGIPEVMQIGGNATIGKGIVRIVAWGNKNE